MRASNRPIHLINPMAEAAGGSEWRTLNLYHALSEKADVTLWAYKEADQTLAEQAKWKTIDPARLSFPRSGTFVFMGSYFYIGRWILLAKPKRVILVYNTSDPGLLVKTLPRLRRAFGVEAELVYCSQTLKDEAGLSGIVETSLFDLTLFSPPTVAKQGQFTLGRLSRPDPAKHHPGDLELYARLSSNGCGVRVMGATPAMIAAGENLEGVELRPPNVEPSSTFLRELDCFFYRTDPNYREPWGRVITEALACGLPVVAHRAGGYAAIIESGVNGFLFDTEEEAFEIIMTLKKDSELRRRVGAAARATAERLVSTEARSQIVDFYLR